MDKLIITALLLQTILILMWVFTQNNRLKSIEGKIRANKEDIKLNTVRQANQILKEVEERGQFIDKSLGTLAENTAALGYEINKVVKKRNDLGRS